MGEAGMSAGPLVVTYKLSERSREIVAEELQGAAPIIYLADLAPEHRAAALGSAAGIDWVPTRGLPPNLPVAANKGGGTEPMSEHIAALALAAAKRLFVEHDRLKKGEFNQHAANKMLRGGVCGIFGFGNVGAATARLMR